MKEYEYNQKAMGTEVSISIVCNSQDVADELSQKTFDVIHSYEQKFSRFIPTSELSLLNTNKSYTVSAEFIELLQEASKLVELTQGVFNPLVQIKRFGYTEDFKKISPDEIRDTSTAQDYDINFSSIHIDSTNSMVKLQKDQELDFGGFLKGYLAEKMCAQIYNSADDIVGVIVNIGGDLHTKGLDELGQKFMFTIYNPITQTTDISVPVYNQSLATSGTYKRAWKTHTRSIHHILDPSGTKNPDTPIISASIISKHGGESEAYTKVCICLPLDDALKIIPEEISYILIQQDGSIIKNIQ